MKGDSKRYGTKNHTISKAEKFTIGAKRRIEDVF